MNTFALLLASELKNQGDTLVDLPDLLHEHGGHEYDAHPGVLAGTLTKPTTGRYCIGWHPDTWRALRGVLGDPPKARMMPLLKAFYSC